MPWVGGIFTRTNGVNTGPTLWALDQAQGFNIITSHHDTNDQDIATGLQNCVTVDGLNKLAASFIPAADATYNIGSTTVRFQNEYLSGSLFLYNGNTNAAQLVADTLTGSRTVTIPDVSGAMVVTVATQTLTNKTLTSPTIGGAATITATETISGLVTMSGAAINEAQATIASATTTAIGAAAANYLNVTGTTAITAFDTIQAGTRRILEFAGILTLTNNATSLILPTGANITTAAGDVAEMVSEGSGNWRCTNYQTASGASLASFTGGTLTSTTSMSGAAFNEARTTIASATTTNIGAAAANYLQVTGTTTITAFDTVQAGTRRILEFASVLTLTQNATTLILPGSANITTAAGDVAIMMSEGSGNWRCASYTRVGGGIITSATKAQQQAATDGLQAVTASVQQQHPSAVKGYGIVATAGTAVAGAYPAGATSVKNSTGNYTITHGLTFATTNYAVALTAEGTAAQDSKAKVIFRTTTTVTVEYLSGGSVADGNIDYALFGTLA